MRGDDAPSGICDESLGDPQTFVINVGRHDGGTFPSKHECACPTDTAASTRYNCDFAVDLAHVFLPLFALYVAVEWLDLPMVLRFTPRL